MEKYFPKIPWVRGGGAAPQGIVLRTDAEIARDLMDARRDAARRELKAILKISDVVKEGRPRLALVAARASVEGILDAFMNDLVVEGEDDMVSVRDVAVRMKAVDSEGVLVAQEVVGVVAPSGGDDDEPDAEGAGGGNATGVIETEAAHGSLIRCCTLTPLLSLSPNTPHSPSCLLACRSGPSARRSLPRVVS
jgi:hypothetical protein